MREAHLLSVKMIGNPVICAGMTDLKKNKKLIVVAGPTAVGKTAVAIRLAKYFGTEIISADSRQFFRELTIGTAKPSQAELAAAPHHFINTHSITDQYDAAQFGDDSIKLLDRIFQRHDYAVMCGGSGLYIKAALEGFDDIPEVAPAVREELIRQYEAHGLEWLQQRMTEEDPGYYDTVDQQNPHRLIRALEVKMGTGQSITAFQKRIKRALPFVVVKIGLELPREELYQRIDYRMDQMIAEGLFQEAQDLYPYRHHQALQTVGYQEIFDFMDGIYDREEAVRLLKRNTRRYAKRQMTWFKRDSEMRWCDPNHFDAILKHIEGDESEF